MQVYNGSKIVNLKNVPKIHKQTNNELVVITINRLTNTITKLIFYKIILSAYVLAILSKKARSPRKHSPNVLVTCKDGCSHVANLRCSVIRSP